MEAIEGEVVHSVVARVRLIVTELVSESVRDAGCDTIRVVVNAPVPGVRGEVTELGPDRLPRPPELHPFRQGGFGLLLVQRLADRWGALEARRGTWFEIDAP